MFFKRGGIWHLPRAKAGSVWLLPHAQSGSGQRSLPQALLYIFSGAGPTSQVIKHCPITLPMAALCWAACPTIKAAVVVLQRLINSTLHEARH